MTAERYVTNLRHCGQRLYWIWITLSPALDLISLTRVMTLRAKSNSDLACGELSPSRTVGLPLSPDLRMSGSSWTFPRKETPNCFAVLSAPPREKISISWLQCGQTK